MSAKVFPNLKYAGGWIFFLTFCVRQVVLLRLGTSSFLPNAEGDMKFYHNWALQILEGRFSDGFAFYGLPGYPFLVAGIYKLFSVEPILVAEIQALSESFVAYLTYNIAKMIFQTPENGSFSAGVGIVAAVGYAFYLPAQAFSGILMPASLLVLSFWGMTWWSLRERTSKIRRWESLGIGIGIGVTAMIVATIFFVLPLSLITIFRQTERRVQNAFLLLAGVFIGCSPAFTYNRLIAHDNVFLSAHGGLNFFIGNNEEANGYLKIPSGLRTNQSEMLADSISVAARALQTNDQLPRSAVSAYWSKRAQNFIREQPGRWIKLLGQKFCNFWNAYQYDDLSVIRSFSSMGISTPGIRYGIVSALGLAGIVLCVKSPNVKSRWVIAAVMLHLASVLTVFITERYRLAAVPGLLIMAAYFLAEFWKSLVGCRWLRVSRSLLVVSLTTFFVTIPVPNQGAWALDSYNNGIRLLQSNDLSKAESELKLAWQYASNNSNTNLALGNLYLAKNDPRFAQEFYRRTLLLDPKNTAALNNLGHIALKEEMPETAIQFFTQTIAIMPENVLAHYQLAQAYLKAQRPDAALLEIEIAMKLKADYAPFFELKKDIESQISGR